MYNELMISEALLMSFCVLSNNFRQIRHLKLGMIAIQLSMCTVYWHMGFVTFLNSYGNFRRDSHDLDYSFFNKTDSTCTKNV